MMTMNENGQSLVPAGFRLKKLEVFNWGTFNTHTWSITPNNANALLTGDIGSGKSTLVDAITTLLVPQQKVIFNKAAGAESKERTVYSYIRGAYKNTKVENDGKSQDVYLRDENSYSVLIGIFHNEELEMAYSLAQVFWIKNHKPEKFYVIANQELTVKAYFSDFGSDILKLKKIIRSTSGFEVFDSFLDYSNRFRQLFGIKHTEALDLFNQTISMKSVGNLTDFVRDQMLGKTQIKDKVEELVKRYQELTEAHQSVEKARRQQEMLMPMMDEIVKYHKITDEINAITLATQELPIWFAHKYLQVLKDILQQLNEQYQKNEIKIADNSEVLENDRKKALELHQMRDNLEITRELEKLEGNLKYLKQEKLHKEKDATKYIDICRKLAFIDLIEEDFFFQNINRGKQLGQSNRQRLTFINEELNRLNISCYDDEKIVFELNGELQSLKQRKTQIPEKNLALRHQILTQLAVDEQEIPFIGELIKVREDEKSWEGAIERKLHDFGLSLLVPERHYQRFSQLVNQLHLNGRLVFFRVFEEPEKDIPEVLHNSLVRKVEIKHDTEFYEWLEYELARKHNFICCDSIEEFQHEYYAITKQGLIKSGKIRHEKDDRRNILDKRNFILGWSNSDKIIALENDLTKVNQKIQHVKKGITQLKSEDSQLTQENNWIKELLDFSNFKEIDFKNLVIELQALEQKKQQLENGSLELQDIQQQIDAIKLNIKNNEYKQDENLEERGNLKEKIRQNILLFKNNLEKAAPNVKAEIKSDTDNLKNPDLIIQNILQIQPEAPVFSALIKKIVVNIETYANLNMETLEKMEKKMTDKILEPGGSLDKLRSARNAVDKKIVMIMKDYRNQYPAETIEVDANIEAIVDFQKIYNSLVEDDIPRFIERFKKLLKEGTIHGIAMFKTKLESFENEVKIKIEDINRHLKEIDYNPGTYITIVDSKVITEDIKNFRLDLTKCLENTFGSDDYYNEEKFLQVQRILQRFRCSNDEDKKWTEKVTDVRQWFTFGASERYREDDTEKEYFSDSSGKSGGQKEKLAYTILASAIAFQFGLSTREKQARSFRFAVIDEAFGRGSDESTRYGLQLFKKLDLQLLIVTPLQKINIIEDYINAVHLVSNPTGQNSLVRNISIALYRKEKEAYFANLQQTLQ